MPQLHLLMLTEMDCKLTTLYEKVSKVMCGIHKGSTEVVSLIKIAKEW